MIQFSPCKINIGLYVNKRRKDGYHDLESIFYPIHWNDIIEITPSERFSFVSKGLKIPGSAEDNLCIKAYLLLKNKFDLNPVNIFLHKNIPMGAGLGGGSSNAITTLLILNNLFKLKLKKSDLKKYALELGSDCPFFIENKAKFVSGRGEKMQNINVDLSKHFIHLVFPNIHIPTKEAFSSLLPDNSRTFCKDSKILKNIDTWKNFYTNDFEKNLLLKYNELASIKELLYKAGALFVSMSGSGSCFYAIFKNKPNYLFSNNKNYIEKILFI